MELMPTEQPEFYAGSFGRFYWLVADYCLDDILRAFPEIVVGRYIAITALDSGPIRGLSEEDRAKGWTLRNEIAYSPKLEREKELSDFYWNSYDEWYVFRSPVDLGKRVAQEVNIFQTPAAKDEVVPFVNYFLNLHSRERGDLVDLFWKQMDWIDPYVYLADSQSALTIVSSDPDLIENSQLALQSINS